MAEPQATDYIVLRRVDGDGNTWRPDGPHQTARSSDQAVKQAAELRHETDTDPNGVYVAIPLRSWKPTTVKVETAFKIGGAS